LSGHQPERQLDQASDQQRNRDQQADLRIAQAEIGPDQRERRALRAVGELIDKLDDQRDDKGGSANEANAKEATTTGAAGTTNLARTAQQPPDTITKPSDRSTSHVPHSNRLP
jgi:hypothetical protein